MARTRSATTTSLLATSLLLTSACAGIFGDAKIERALTDPNTTAGLICDVVVDDFSEVALGAFPKGWETFDKSDLPQVQASGAFSVAYVDGQRVLHARYKGKAVALGHGIPHWDLQRYPYLTWRWRALVFPKGGDETKSDLDDTAASVQAVWLIGLPFMVRTLRHTWSSTLPAGTRASWRLGHDQLVVLEGGIPQRSRWRQATVNVLECYQKWFGLKDSQAPTGISIQTDADATHSAAEAYYADFRLCRRAAPTSAATQAKNEGAR